MSRAQEYARFECFATHLENQIKPAYCIKRALQDGFHPQTTPGFLWRVFRATPKIPLDLPRPPYLPPPASVLWERFGTPRQPQVTASVAGGAAQEGQLVFFKGHGYGKLHVEGHSRSPHTCIDHVSVHYCVGLGGACDARCCRSARLKRPSGLVHTPARCEPRCRRGFLNACTLFAEGTPRWLLFISFLVRFFASLVFRRLEEALKDLSGFDMIWVISHMHLNKGWNPKVRPPRLPEERKGLFSTRSPHRPNAVALSSLRVDSVDVSKGVVHVHGLDLLDGERKRPSVLRIVQHLACKLVC